MKRWVRDIIYSCVLLVFCAVMWIESNGFVQNLIKVEIAKPTAYAHLWIGLLAALAVLQLIRALKNKPDEELPRIFTPLAIITLGSLVVYVATVRLLGFLLDTFLLMSLLLLSYAAAPTFWPARWPSILTSATTSWSAPTSPAAPAPSL